MENGLFAKYISKRKVTQQEIDELYAYPNAVVTTTVYGIRGLAATLNAQFKGKDFQEILFDGNLTDRDATQCLRGYVCYLVEVDYCEGINIYGQKYARKETWEVCTNMLDFLLGNDKMEGLLQLLYLISMVMFVVLILIT